MTRTRLVRLAVLGPLVAGLVTASVPAAPAEPAPRPSTAPPASGAEEPKDTLFQEQGTTRFDVTHYDVRLSYEPLTNALAATTVVRAVPRGRLSRVSLDLTGMRVSTVRVDGETARWVRRGAKLVVTPQRPLTRAFSVRVAYAGTPVELTDADGSTEGWVRTTDGAIALGEPVGASTWVPSNNTPGDKATWTFRVDVPDTVQVAANGDLSGHRATPGARGRSTWVWDVTDPMPTYLATVAIGRFGVHTDSFRSVDGRRIPIWSFVDVTSGGTDQAAEARAQLPEVLAFEEDLFGPYPFTSAGMIVDDASVGYALETQSRPFYPGNVTALVHENAHQWFGDSVSIRDWHDLWLAEGFATYAEWLYDAAHDGASTKATYDVLYARPEGDDLWRPAPTRFTDPADLFGVPVYLRGAMTLEALRQHIGDGDFFRLVKAWARAHRHGSVRTSDFVVFAERVSGRSLDGFFRDWLVKARKPAGY